MYIASEVMFQEQRTPNALELFRCFKPFMIKKASQVRFHVSYSFAY